MKTQNSKRSVISIILIISMIAGLTFTLKAQTTIEVYNESDNTIVVRLKSNNKMETPEKILLVYDSNLIALETTSNLAKNFIYNANVNVSNYSAATSVASAMSVDAEEEIEIEDWMLKPFSQNTTSNYLKVDTEEDIPLEPWMTDLSKWN